MNNKSPLVSIIAVCYNHEEFLKFTLDSIQNQTYSNLEVLIIDSCSKDNSYKLIEEYIISNNLGNWKVFKQSKPTTICQNLNYGLSQISGEFYQVISCDDVILPNKIESQIANLSSNQIEYGLIYGDYSHIDEHGILIQEDSLVLRKKGFSEGKFPPTGFVFCTILGSWYIHTLTCLIRTDAARSIGGYDETLSYEDTDFILRLSRSFPFLASLDETAHYRILSNSFFRSRSVEFYVSTCKLYLKHLDEVSCIKNVRRLASHYFDTLFIMDHHASLKLYQEYESSSFEAYVSAYVLAFRISGNKFLALKVKDFTKSIFKKWA